MSAQGCRQRGSPLASFIKYNSLMLYRYSCCRFIKYVCVNASSVIFVVGSPLASSTYFQWKSASCAPTRSQTSDLLFKGKSLRKGNEYLMMENIDERGIPYTGKSLTKENPLRVTLLSSRPRIAFRIASLQRTPSRESGAPDLGPRSGAPLGPSGALLRQRRGPGQAHGEWRGVPRHPGALPAPASRLCRRRAQACDPTGVASYRITPQRIWRNVV